ncbi:MAG: AAA family ATPase [Lachnospiraceae bacterium]|nr:AAA family ATPase [Lachnospiraceae bacterium]
MKHFNTTAICFPEKHYMVDTSGRIRQIVEELIEQNKYFTINRARQYGKTTILSGLKAALKDTYYVVKISFEGLGEAAKTENGFVKTFVGEVGAQLKLTFIQESVLSEWNAPFPENMIFFEHSPVHQSLPEKDSLLMPDFAYTLECASITALSRRITELCTKSDREIILMIDEVDAVSNNELFLNFLGMLRKKYISATEGEDATFKSVILAGVYDIKNVQMKLRPEEEHRYNSPWNIAADFDVDLSFQANEIEDMLKEYRRDHALAFDTAWFAERIYDYTSGYPFLVSRVCWLLDTKVCKEPEFLTREAAWTGDGFQRALKLLLKEKNTLFDDLNKKLDENADLKDLVYRIVVCRENILFNLNDNRINLGAMFGWFRERSGMTVIANRIFETLICDKLVQERTSDFLENEARILFLTFLKPVINGAGNYYLEAEAFDKTRTDIVVDYQGCQYIIELKIYHGESYEQSGREQLCGYLEKYNLPVGWLLSFCFHKEKEKLTGTGIVEINGKSIHETIL